NRQEVFSFRIESPVLYKDVSVTPGYFTGFGIYCTEAAAIIWTIHHCGTEIPSFNIEVAQPFKSEFNTTFFPYHIAIDFSCFNMTYTPAKSVDVFQREVKVLAGFDRSFCKGQVHFRKTDDHYIGIEIL